MVLCVKMKKQSITETHRHTHVRMHKSGKHWVRTVISKVAWKIFGQSNIETKSISLASKSTYSSASLLMKSAMVAGLAVAGGELVQAQELSQEALVTKEEVVLEVGSDVASLSLSASESLWLSQSSSLSQSESIAFSQEESLSHSFSESESVSESESLSGSDSISVSESQVTFTTNSEVNEQTVQTELSPLERLETGLFYQALESIERALSQQVPNSTDLTSSKG